MRLSRSWAKKEEQQLEKYCSFPGWLEELRASRHGQATTLWPAVSEQGLWLLNQAPKVLEDAQAEDVVDEQSQHWARVLVSPEMMGLEGKSLRVSDGLSVEFTLGLVPDPGACPCPNKSYFFKRCDSRSA